MKGSVENNVASDRNDYLVGDGLRLQLTINRNVLSITGDGCRVSLGSNSGHLRIIGDGCRVNIGCNVGYVEYNGDGGRIVLGPESLDRSRIKYRGVGGVIEFGQVPKRKGEPDKPKSTRKSGTKREEARARRGSD